MLERRGKVSLIGTSLSYLLDVCSVPDYVQAGADTISDLTPAISNLQRLRLRNKCLGLTSSAAHSVKS